MKSKDVAELYDQVPVGAVVQIIPDGLPKTEKAKPRQEMSGGVVAVAANVTPPPQKTGLPSARQGRRTGIRPRSSRSLDLTAL